MDTSFDALEERVNIDHPESWLPEMNDSHPNPLSGEVVARREVATRRDTVETVLVVRAADTKEWSVWLFGVVLQRELADAQPGAAVAVRWLGMRSNAEGTLYRGYRVALDVNPQAKRSRRSATRGKEDAA